MTTTVAGSHGHSVMLDLGTTRNIQIAGQLASMLLSSSSGIGGRPASGFGEPASSDTVSPTSAWPSSVSLPSGMTSFAAASVSGGSLQFLGETTASITGAASTATASGNTTLGGGLGQDLNLSASNASLTGALGGQTRLVGGAAAGSDLLPDLTKVVSAAASPDTTSTVKATAGTTITLSDATRITFQSVVLHSNNH